MGYLYILAIFCAISLTSANSFLRYLISYADCDNVPYGWLVRNPLDCGSYFVCEDEIQLEKCPSLLHFDAVKRVCNWPDKAKCDWTALPTIIIPDIDEYLTSDSWQEKETTVVHNPTTTTVKTTEIPTTTTPRPTTTTSKPSTHRPTTTTSIPSTPKPTTTTPKTSTETPTTTTSKPSTQRPTTTTSIPSTSKPSTQKPTTTTVDWPKTTTESYPLSWLCENVVLHDHKVGEVESSFGAFDKEAGKAIDPMKTYDPSKVKCLYEGVYFLPHPTACDNYYICAHRTLIAHSCGTGISWNYKTNKCDFQLKSNCYSKDAGKHTTKYPSPPTEDTHTTRYVTPEKPKTTLNPNLPICPMHEQTYYPHHEDCRKYYICISGLPVLTTCPDELFWDDVHKICNLPQYTECKANKKH